MTLELDSLKIAEVLAAAKTVQQLADTLEAAMNNYEKLVAELSTEEYIEFNRVTS